MAPRKLSPTFFVLVALTSLFVLLALFQPAPFDPLEMKLYDGAMNLARKEGAISRRVILIEVDEKSIQVLGPWPFPRQILAEMVSLLSEHGAKVIGLDIPLGEKETNPGLKELKAFRERFNAYSFSKKDEVLRPWVLENLRDMEERLEADRLLVERTKQAGNVVLPVWEREETRPDQENDPVLPKNSVMDGGISLSADREPSGAHMALPYPELSEVAMGVGYTGLSPKRGMEGRSHPLIIRYKDALLPSLSFRVAMAYLEQNPKQVVVDDAGVRIRDFSIPLWNGEMLVGFRRSADGPPRYSFAEILRDKTIPIPIDGRIVLIGLNLEETRKTATPLSSATPVTEFYAQVIESLLANDFIGRPFYLIFIEIGVILILGVSAASFSLRIGRFKMLALAVGLMVLFLGVEFFLFSRSIWLKSGFMATFVVALYLALTLSDHLFKVRTGPEAAENHRELGIRLQSQGLLDQAFYRFCKIPLDRETKDLICRLGLEYERRQMVDKALDVYEYVRNQGNFHDLDDRISRLKGSESPKGEILEGAGEAIAVQDCGSGSGSLPTKVGRYEVIQELGKGAMGVVYKAFDPKMNRLLAIKTIRFSDEFDREVIQEIRERFLREAEIAGRLSHPSIVTIYDIGEDQDLTYTAMEFLEGDDLEKFVTKGNLLPLRSVLEIVAYVADALDFAHKCGVIHRDVKPANIMLLKQGGVKVTDFGVAKAISSSRTRTGVILGTPNYMSPEQIMGHRIDYRSDIFSLGVLLYHLLTGELPFHGDNLSTLLYQITQAKHPSVRNSAPKVPRACEQIVDKAMTKNPSHRFTSAGELARLARLVISKMDQLRDQQPKTGL